MQLPRLAPQGQSQRAAPGWHGAGVGWGCPRPCPSLRVHLDGTGRARGSQPTEDELHQGGKIVRS